MYGNQVQGRKVAGSSKQATVEDSGVTLQNTVDDVEKHLMSLVAVNIKYNVQTKHITEIGLFWLNYLCNFEFEFHSSKYTWPRSIHEE